MILERWNCAIEEVACVREEAAACTAGAYDALRARELANGLRLGIQACRTWLGMPRRLAGAFRHAGIEHIELEGETRVVRKRLSTRCFLEEAAPVTDEEELKILEQMLRRIGAAGRDR